MLRVAISVAAVLIGAGEVSAEGDVALGEQKFLDKCALCHNVGDTDLKNGPTLNHLIGRPAASMEGFRYSDGMLEAGQKGVVWDLETLTKFITKPRTVVNGSNMAFTGLSNPDDVANVIAYLATFSPPTAE
jgi:cytochrome c